MRVALLEAGTIKHLAVGDVVYDVGDVLTHAVIIETGVVSEITVLEDGAQAESGTVGNESQIGAASLMMNRSAARAYVVRISGSALFVPLEALDATIGRNFEARNVYMKLGEARLNASLQLTACQAAHSAEQRTARWLLQAHDRVPEDGFYLKQATLAEALGLRRATVSEICSAFAASGAIAYARGHVRVLDRTKLEAQACICYRVIASGFDAALGPPPPRPSCEAVL